MNSPDALVHLIKHLPDGLVLLDPSGLVQYMNPAAEKLTESTIDESRYRHWRDVFTVRIDDSARDQTGSLVEILLERPYLISKSGRAIPIELEIVPVEDRDGFGITSMLILHDVTRSNSEKEGLQESRAKYKRLVNTIEGVVWEAEGEEMRIRYVSDYAEKLFGYPARSWSRDSGFWKSIILREDLPKVLEVVTHALRNRENYHIEYHVITAGGEMVLVRDSVTVHEEEGLLRVSGVMTDITAAKQARDALIQSEERYSAAFAANPVALLMTTESGIILDANESFERLTGYFREELLQRPVIDSGLYTDAEFSAMRQALGDRQQLVNHPCPTRLRNGEQRSVRTSLRRILLSEAPCLLLVFHSLEP